MAEFADRISRVATVFNVSDFAVTASYLEAHGIVVVATPVHAVNNLQHYVNAFGGVSVLVPERQAQAAINLLIQADRGETEIKDDAPKLMKPKNWFQRLVELAFYGSMGGAPPYRSRLVHGQWKALSEEEI